MEHGKSFSVFIFVFNFCISTERAPGRYQPKRSKQQQKYKEPTKHFLCSDCGNFLFAFRSEICTQQHDNDKGKTSEPMKKKKLPKRNEHHQPPSKDRPLQIGLPDILQM